MVEEEEQKSYKKKIKEGRNRGMKVKELINKLLDCKMDADVTVLKKKKKDVLKDNLEHYGNCSYPIDDDIEIKEIINYTNNAVSIVLKEF